MLNSELLASQRRLQDRAKAHSQRVKEKADKERIIAERQAARLEAREEAKRQQRIAQQKAEELERAQYEADLERNNGVYYRATLRAVPAPEDIASLKGVKRAADKILLPPSAGNKLMSQDAYKNGAMFFELDNGTGRTTHAGLLEFTAAEGFVMLPLKVIKCLWGPDATAASCDGLISVVYRKLNKGNKVVFQPRSAQFQQEIGDDIRSVLESALLQHSALTEKDWVQVLHYDKIWDLRVRELSPDTAVSVIDTDLEAEINPSIETEERIRAEEEEAQRRLEETAKAALEQAALMREEAEREAELAQQAEQDRLQRLKIQEEKSAALPAEPDADAKDVSSIMFRLPDGSRLQRRFCASDSIQLLFDFVDSKGASGMRPGEYGLVTSFPRRVFTSSSTSEGNVEEKSQLTLAAAGLVTSDGGGREVLYLEPNSGS